MSFSIDTSSSYGSIFDHSKALKQRQDAQKTNFANTFIKEQALKANDISNANLQSIAKEMALQEALSSKSNSNNNSAQSLSNQALLNNKNISDYSARILNELAYQSSYSSPPQTSIYALKFRGAEGLNSISSTNSAYGYSVDNEGFMGADFNKVAGLPEDFRVHKSTLEAIEQANENSPHILETKKYLGISKYYQNIDMASTIGQYYNVFSQAIDVSFSDDKTSFSKADISSMPSGYAVNGFFNGYGIFQHSDANVNQDIQNQGLVDYSQLKISAVYKTPEQLKEANEIDHMSSGLIKGIKGKDMGLSLEGLDNVLSSNNGFKPDMSVYATNENGEYGKEALFMSFLKSQEGRVLYSPNNELSVAAKNYNALMAKESFSGPGINIDKVMTSGDEFKDFIKYWAQRDLMGAQIYAYENNISSDNAIGTSFHNSFMNALNNGYKPQSSTIDGFSNALLDRLYNLMSVSKA